MEFKVNVDAFLIHECTCYFLNLNAIPMCFDVLSAFWEIILRLLTILRTSQQSLNSVPFLCADYWVYTWIAVAVVLVSTKILSEIWATDGNFRLHWCIFFMIKYKSYSLFYSRILGTSTLQLISRTGHRYIGIFADIFCVVKGLHVFRCFYRSVEKVCRKI